LDSRKVESGRGCKLKGAACGRGAPRPLRPKWTSASRYQSSTLPPPCPARRVVAHASPALVRRLKPGAVRLAVRGLPAPARGRQAAGRAGRGAR
jgi:hypothetical protein